MNCNVCGAIADFAFETNVLKKYKAAYYFCENCGLLQTEEPYWLEEAYGNAIADADTGLVQRNLDISKRLSCLLYFLFDRDGTYLDAAGGYGMLTRLMRDVGFDFYWTDKYCENLLAKGFEFSADKPTCTVATAFEVFEHLHDPISFINQLRSETGANSIVFSTVLFEGTPPKPGDWWYYAFETGQHISFYQRKTLEVIAERIGLTCYSNGSIHLYTNRKINSFAYKLLTSPRITRALYGIPKLFLTSKTFEDHVKIMDRN